MYTLLLPGRAHLLSADAGSALLDAIDRDLQFVTVPIELNGEGSGAWTVTVNVKQVVALIHHPITATQPNAMLRLLT